MATMIEKLRGRVGHLVDHMVLLAQLARSWRDALLIVKPETILRWRRRGSRLFWRRKSKSYWRSQRIPEEVVSLIREMALANRLWGAE